MSGSSSNCITQGKYTDTYRRSGPDSEISRQIRKYCPAILAGGPGYSVRPLEFGERTPPAMRAHVHGNGEFALSPGHSVDGGADLGHGLVAAEGVVAGQ